MAVSGGAGAAPCEERVGECHQQVSGGGEGDLQQREGRRQHWDQFELLGEDEELVLELRVRSATQTSTVHVDII